MREWLHLIGLRIKVALFNFVEFFKVAFHFYRYPKFLRYDFSLWKLYLFDSPFVTSKIFHQRRGDKEIHVYGETPLSSWAEIAKKANITPKDVVFDLGAGRGRLLLWLEGVIGCKAVGIEQIPRFVERFRPFESGRVEMRGEDLLKTDLSSGTLFYLYNFFLSEKTLKALAFKLSLLPRGTRVVSVSFPITDYTVKYVLVDIFPVRFPWGVAEVFISEKN